MKITKWNIDPTNTEATFKVRKLMVTNVIGQFKSIEGQAETATEDFESIKRICFKAAINSIKTDDPKRDEHLKSADFFDREQFPYLLFVAENFAINDKELHTNLTIKNTTKAIVLAIDSYKKTITEDKSDKIELSLSGKINRRDFGLTWDGTNAAGEIFVGDEIKLSAKIQFVKEAQNANLQKMKECTL
ncbi:YceI family protein [Flavobacterium antarcticum]|uniref:YceI family protein n=1 Tax=Flavobacterium antarcticum TaxID=271155 RepID=UPI0003FF3643|nr:YceI family protein [Flavobacterium antarcticum]